MRMGKITAVRDDSPAAKAGIQPDDIIDVVEIREGASRVQFVSAPTPGKEVVLKTLDPVRLPFELAQWAGRQKGAKEVTLTVLRKNPPPNHNEQQPVKLTLTWDDRWEDNDEVPIGMRSPLSVPGLGLAYRVETTVADVANDSPADKAGLKKDDVIKAVRVYQAGKTPEDKGKAGDWMELPSDPWALAC